MSDLNQATITIYNSYTTGGLPPFGNIQRWEKTVIHGVAWNDQIDRNPKSDGKTAIDQTVLITIPKLSMPTDKEYIDPAEYSKLPNDAENFWTLSFSTTEPTYIMLGEGRDLNDLYNINSLRRDERVVTVAGVSDHLNFPGDLAGLEVRCL